MSNYAVTGFYFYSAGVIVRGELEITTLNEMYLVDDLLDVHLLGHGFAWLDIGITGSLLQAANFVETVSPFREL